MREGLTTWILQQGPAGRTTTTTTLIEEGSNILSSTVGESGSRPLFLASVPCKTHWSPPEPEMRDSQSLRYPALALPECLPPSFPEDVTSVDYENLHKERVPLGDGRLRPCRSSPPSVRRTAQKSYSPKKRRPSSPGRRGSLEEPAARRWSTPARPRSRSGRARLQTPLKA